MSTDNPPELSIIVPVFEEARRIAPLLESLAGQRACRFEVIFCDGGSGDETVSKVVERGAQYPFAVHLLETPRGRGRQMNAAADTALGDFLLFLHADSRFSDRQALRRGLDCMRQKVNAIGSDAVAGRFALRFGENRTKESFGYFFYACKARLTRRGCIHGDQGFMLPRVFFHRLDGFDERLPFLEDENLAKKVFQQGCWLLFPTEIETSARRFEREGLRERQTLNALIMNFHDIGWQEFLAEAPGLYRSQIHTERLDLAPFFSEISRMLQDYPASRRRRLWYATGAYVRSQAWQIPYMLHVVQRFRRGQPPAAGWGGPGRWQDLFDRLTDNRIGNWVTAGLVQFWFAFNRLRFRCRRK